MVFEENIRKKSNFLNSENIKKNFIGKIINLNNFTSSLGNQEEDNSQIPYGGDACTVKDF